MNICICNAKEVAFFFTLAIQMNKKSYLSTSFFNYHEPETEKRPSVKRGRSFAELVFKSAPKV